MNDKKKVIEEIEKSIKTADEDRWIPTSNREYMRAIAIGIGFLVKNKQTDINKEG